MEWSPRAAETAGLAVLGVGLALAAVRLDAAGQLLAGAGALLLLVIAARDLLTRPRLAAGPDGVVVRGVAGRTRLPWAGLRVQVRETRRLGLRGRTLELDAPAGPEDDGLLVVLGRRDLGADPEDVARALWTLDPTGR